MVTGKIPIFTDNPLYCIHDIMFIFQLSIKGSVALSLYIHCYTISIDVPELATALVLEKLSSHKLTCGTDLRPELSDFLVHILAFHLVLFFCHLI